MSHLQLVARNARHHIGRSGLLLGIGVVFWYLWVLLSAATSPYALVLTSPYVLTPLALLVGVGAGGLLSWRWRQGKILLLLIVVLVVTALAIPIYANASAAVGGLFLALVGLGLLDLRTAVQSDRLVPGEDRPAAVENRALRQAIVLALVLCASVLLVLDSQAAIALAVPLALVVALAVWRLSGPPRVVTVALGSLVAVAAALAVVLLGSRASWPVWLSDSQSLSGARHTLWSDALSLWATAPIAGSGPGSFTPSSALASNEPSLAAVHSLPLQVGSELGLVGLIILGFLIVAILLIAARGSRAHTLIAVAAWAALAVHSSIDHLEDFPIVAFMAGIIVGWSGLGAKQSEVSNSAKNGGRYL